MASILLNKSVLIAEGIPNTKIKMGSNALTKDIPELFTAVNSECSPKLPKVIIELNKMARGNASGELDIENILVPPLMLQPFIENSIWHGIAPKQGNGQIDLMIKKDDNMLEYVVEDNGVGRSATNTKAKRKGSFGVKITSNRIDIINHLKNTNGSINLLDKTEGLRVEIRLPLELQF